MPTCNFFSSTNHYQSHVQSFGKVLKVFGILLRLGRFYFDYFARWGNLGLFGFHSILIEVELCENWQWLPNQNKNGDNTASKWMIHRKQNKVHAFVHFLVVSEQDTRIHFF